MMETRTVWCTLILLLSFQRSTNSQTDVFVTEVVTQIVTEADTAPPATGTPPLMTPPPPPPPTPPPPPPSTVIPPATTPPPTMETMPPTTRMPTTVAMMTTMMTTPGVTTFPPMNPPNDDAKELGRIGVFLDVAIADFDEANFRLVIAREVNNYCTEYLDTPQECAGGSQTVGPEHVIIVETCDGECAPAEGAVLARSQRKLLQTAVTQVDYYVANPTSSYQPMMTTAQQTEFLQDEAFANQLEEDIGFSGIPSTYLPPPEEPLEGWEIALIVIGSVAFVCIVAGSIAGFIYYRRKHNAKDEMDFELQNTKLEVDEEDTNRGNDYTTIGTTAVANGMNGTTAPKKQKAEEVDFSSQVKYKEIIEATGYKPVQEKLKEVQEKNEEVKVNGDVPKSKEATGTSMVVTADIASSSSSSSSQNDVSEKAATAEEKQEVPPKYPSDDDETRKVEEEAAAVVGELDNLVADQKKEDEKTAFENPAYDAVTDVDEDGIAKTSL